METHIFSFNSHEIEFGFEKSNVMVNATEMAKIYGKKVNEFTSNENTKNFISAALKNGNSRFLNVEKEEDLIISSQKSGTFMHRVLALKFAAWLDPDFEIWVYKTIDTILFDYYKKIEESLKQSANRKNRMDELKERLRINNEFQELEKLELEERQAASNRGKQNRNQLDLFRGSEL